MKRLNDLWGDYVYITDMESPLKEWHDNSLSKEELEQIFTRGNTQEIVLLINKYGEFAARKGNKEALLPVVYQNKIARRGIDEEINAYISYQGFAPAGQHIIVSRGSHRELMNYLSRHGLSAEEQKNLLARGNRDEIDLHIRQHGLAKEFLDNVFIRVEADRDYSLFNRYISLHELPVSYQKKMLGICDEEALQRYFERYGLWEQAHEALMCFCSANTIIEYLKRHHYLSPEAEGLMVRRTDGHLLTMTYLQNWRAENFTPSDHIISMLILAPETNYEALALFFSKMTYSHWSEQQEAQEDKQLMQNGTEEQIVKRFEQGKGLDAMSLSVLFFQRDRRLFDIYVTFCKTKKIRHICF